MAMFLLHDETDPEKDMFVINPNVLPVEDEVVVYADRFTQEAHDAGRTTEELIPLGGAVLELATNPDN